MSASVDIEVPRPNRLHITTGMVVLAIGYVALLLLIGWLKQ